MSEEGLSGGWIRDRDSGWGHKGAHQSSCTGWARLFLPDPEDSPSWEG